MKKANKVWGETTELFNNNGSSTHYLEVKAGGYCSEHKHEQKDNVFYVIEGRLEIASWVGDEKHIRVLGRGDGYRIPVGVWHMFRALTDVKCVEVYDYKYDGVDIQRRTQGGLGSD
jgi:mannose-6-phosphate isomerase-like protein (cupin superfamily)